MLTGYRDILKKQTTQRKHALVYLKFLDLYRVNRTRVTCF